MTAPSLSFEIERAPARKHKTILMAIWSIQFHECKAHKSAQNMGHCVM